jgi:S-adenosylmethionine:tRNA ribosyltransferase-isomerase
MKVSDFDYFLPEESIASYPPDQRGSTRLLVLNRKTGSIMHSAYARLDDFLQPGDLLVLNNSRVVRARLFAEKPTGARIELLLLEKHEEAQNLVLYRGKVKRGDLLLVHGNELLVEELHEQGVARLSWQGEADLAGLFDRFGSVPIPPYLKRDAETVDRERYQTVFAELPGSVAAPTASLNMTDDLLQRLSSKGILTARLTLHVGLGTFLPIRSEDPEEHVMHREFYQIPVQTVRQIRETHAQRGRVIAVGTTVARSLEDAAERLSSLPCDEPVSGEADLFIYPGYRFRMVDALVTNFHAPRSTVLMLTAAFAGREALRQAYRDAVGSGYRFLSYGDSMFIF